MVRGLINGVIIINYIYLGENEVYKNKYQKYKKKLIKK